MRLVERLTRNLGGYSVSACYLVGAFDLLNVRHLDALRQLRSTFDRLVVGVLTDEDVEDLNGRPPVVPLSERVELMRHVRGVDRVDVHDRLSPAGDAVWFGISGERLPSAPPVQWLDVARHSLSADVCGATASIVENRVA